MFLIGTNALPLLANITTGDDGNLTLPAFYESAVSG